MSQSESESWTMPSTPDRSATAETSGAPPPEPARRKWPYARIPDVADLRTRECWICKEDETFTSRLVRKGPWTSRWIHPCKCTLIAHESCLLEWIARSQQSLSPAPKCPQCNTPFVISTRRPLILKALDWVDSKKSIVVNFLVITGITGGILIVSTAYGVHALRLFVGKEMSRLMIGEGISEWPLEAWINLPLVPLSLIITQTSAYDPFLLSIPFFIAPYFNALNTLPGSSPAAFPSSSSSRTDALIMSYPPTPQLIIAFFPLVKLIYSSIRRGIYEFVLAPSAASRRNGTAQPALGLEDLDVPRIREEFGIQVQIEDRDGNRQNWARDVILNGTSFTRLICYSLSLPVISSVTGGILLFISGYSRPLRRFLGLEGLHKPITPLLRFNNSARMAGLGLHAVHQVGMDPIWWRNTVGLCLFIVTTDALYLLHGWLQQRERRSRRIESRNFEGVDLEGLDLII